MYEINFEALQTREKEDWASLLIHKLHSAPQENDTNEGAADDSRADMNDGNELMECPFGVADVAGKKVLYAVMGDEQIQLDTMYDSDVFLDLWYRGQKKKLGYQTKVFMYGLGNGMYARKLLKEMASDNLLFVYEPSVANIRFLFTEFSYADILKDSRIVLLVGEVLTKKLNTYFTARCNYADISGMIVQHYLNYNRLFEKNYYEYMNELQIAVRSINATQYVYDRYGLYYFMNSVENLGYLRNSKSFHQLSQRIPEGIPAIIVAAGPSLDKNVEDLKAAKNKALIIAVDSSLRVLLKHGIVPDLVVSVDGVKMATHFEYPGASEVPLVCMVLTNYKMLQQHNGMMFFIHDCNAYLQEFFKEHNLLLPLTGSGGSVANSAMSIAQVMSITKIILVGQDLAYTDNKTHSVDSIRGSWGKDASEEATSVVEAYDGGTIISSTEFDLYRSWIEEQIMTSDYLRVINATEGGAKIHGAEQMPLKQAIAELCVEEYDMKEIVQGTPDLMNDEQKAAFIPYINQMDGKLEECYDVLKKDRRIYQKMLELIYADKYHSAELTRLSAQVAEYNDFLDSAPIIEYAENLIQEESSKILDNLNLVNDDEKRDLIEITKTAINYLDNMEIAIKRARNYFKLRMAPMWERSGVTPD